LHICEQTPIEQNTTMCRAEPPRQREDLACHMTWHRVGASLTAAAAATLAAATLTSCTDAVQGRGQSSPICAPAFFGVPGSGEGADNPPPGRVPTGVSAADARQFGSTEAVLKRQLEVVAGDQLGSASAVAYPAAPVDRYLGITGLTPDLDRSETAGITTLLRGIRSVQRNGCGNRPVLLSGYSQGAEVVIRTVGRLSRTERAHVAVALFGNPSHRPGTVPQYPGGVAGSGVRPTFLNGMAYTLPVDLRARSLDVCAVGDPVCGVDPTLSTFSDRVNWVLDHVHVHGRAYAFASPRYATTAAAFLWRHRTG
jgi:Cutinase